MKVRINCGGWRPEAPTWWVQPTAVTPVTTLPTNTMRTPTNNPTAPTAVVPYAAPSLTLNCSTRVESFRCGRWLQRIASLVSSLGASFDCTHLVDNYWCGKIITLSTRVSIESLNTGCLLEVGCVFQFTFFGFYTLGKLISLD